MSERSSPPSTKPANTTAGPPPTSSPAHSPASPKDGSLTGVEIADALVLHNAMLTDEPTDQPPWDEPTPYPDADIPADPDQLPPDDADDFMAAFYRDQPTDSVVPVIHSVAPADEELVSEWPEPGRGPADATRTWWAAGLAGGLDREVPSSSGTRPRSIVTGYGAIRGNVLTSTVQPRSASPSWRSMSPAVVAALFVAAIVVVAPMTRARSSQAIDAWATVFLAMVLQSVPFLVFGVLVSAGVGLLLTDRLLQRALPKSATAGVPVAGLAGLALPGCECAAVPVTGSLIRRGVPGPVALTFLLAAPAINPTVIVSTAIAFQGHLVMVPARIGASFVTAVLVGWWCTWRGGHLSVEHLLGTAAGQRRGRLVDSVRHDFLHAVGYLIVGAAVAASVSTYLPRRWLDAATSNQLIQVAALAALAFLVAACSESDAFLAAGFTAFSNTAKLAFLVVGPAMDVKLASMEAGEFGRRFAVRFVPLVIGVAMLCATAVGWWLL